MVFGVGFDGGDEFGANFTGLCISAGNRAVVEVSVLFALGNFCCDTSLEIARRQLRFYMSWVQPLWRFLSRMRWSS